MTIYEILSKIQTELKAPKSQYNTFGKYFYRNCEDILEAVKPLLSGAVLIISDDIVYVGDRYYIKSTATITFDSVSITNTAYAREEESRKGMDSAQLTGATSSYARKYALNGLFLIDDTKDSDATNKHGKDDGKKSPPSTTPPPPESPATGNVASQAVISDAQGKRMFAIANASKIHANDVKRYLMHFYGVEHSKEIPKDKYEAICGVLESKEKFDTMMKEVPV